MGKRKLLIADASEEFRMALQEYLQDSYHIKSCRDGDETLEVMESFKPDVLILDVLLPGIDGVTLLQRAEAKGLHTTVMATIRFESDYVLDALERLNVGYVMVKPCQVSAIAVRLEDMLAEQKEETEEVTLPDLCTLVDNALRELNFQPASHGYSAVREGILEAIKNPNQQITKTLYPTIGKRCGGNGKQVEHAIRRMIKNAWLYRDQAVWDQYFGRCSGVSITKEPTNKVFLYTVAEYIASENRNRMLYSRKSG